MNLLNRINFFVQESGNDALNDIVFDPSRINGTQGIDISLVGIIVVFLSLFILSVIIFYITRFLIARQRIRARLAEPNEPEKDDYTVTGEINAAISTALHMYLNELHDIENTVLTIQRVPKSYSPWSSKIYNIRKHV